jgi:hypothetical protein
MKIKHLFCFWLGFALLLTSASGSWASKIKPLNLSELSGSAGKIFEGKCLERRSGRDEATGQIVTWYTFQVLEPIKGKFEETITFKQYGGSDNNIVMQTHIAQYEVGEVAILFLYPPSKIGLTSSVGMTQGKFSIKTFPKTGAKFVTNGMPGMVLFEDMPEALPTLDKQGLKTHGQARFRSNRLDKSNFISMVKQIVKKQQVKKK